MNDWLYWGLFVLAVLLVGAVPLASVWERRQDDRDRELWKELHR